ncbi:hypothetical protein RDWZM_002006 [Blomia tropicalis]|uniref:Uncharacterized protein n=1 Tax=Blomia tropicalis TaxID=40697 RepID=A0A9Q0RR68_BLOTA|nr:hypothetical protein RDWZM_002006 [Blomia tropicalis]
MTAAANAFFTNHHRNRINTFDLDQKFISGAHNFLNPVSVGLASPFTQPATTSSSRHLSRSHSIDHFTNDNLENGIDIPRSPADPNRFLSMKLSVNSSDD